MAVDAVDLALWVLLGIGVLFIGCGCLLTSGARNSAKLHDSPYDATQLDRAA